MPGFDGIERRLGPAETASANCADPNGSYHNPEFRKERAVVLYCASGGRSVLAGKTLKDVGYAGGFTTSAGSRTLLTRAFRPKQ